MCKSVFASVYGSFFGKRFCNLNPVLAISFSLVNSKILLSPSHQKCNGVWQLAMKSHKPYLSTIFALKQMMKMVWVVKSAFRLEFRACSSMAWTHLACLSSASPKMLILMQFNSFSCTFLAPALSIFSKKFLRTHTQNIVNNQNCNK